MSLDVGDGRTDQLWAVLPERARVETLAVLAGMIAGGMVAGESTAGGDRKVGS
jgi:hypothetical protein